MALRETPAIWTNRFKDGGKLKPASLEFLATLMEAASPSGYDNIAAGLFSDYVQNSPN
jgi:hypothetical protein